MQILVTIIKIQHQNIINDNNDNKININNKHADFEFE